MRYVPLPAVKSRSGADDRWTVLRRSVRVPLAAALVAGSLVALGGTAHATTAKRPAGHARMLSALKYAQHREALLQQRRAASRFVGAVVSSPDQAAALRDAGLTAVVLPVAWSRAEPTEGTFSAAYLAQVKKAYDTYVAAGLSVTLDLGLQYAPAWALDLPGARFIDQYGDVFSASGASGEAATDAVWNDRVQQAQAGYVRQLGATFGRSAFGAVRLGSLLTGELRYPNAKAAGKANSIWDYSETAQATSPVPGYRPGVSTPSAAGDRALVDHYLDGMHRYQDFLVATAAASFDADLELLYPSWGIRPGDVDAAVATHLDGTSARFSEVAAGVDFAGLVARIPGYATTGRVVAYTTWLDAPDNGGSVRDQSPVAYLSSLTKPLGVALSGENTARTGDDRAALAASRQRVAAYGLVGLMWFSVDLGSSTASVTPAMVAGRA